MRFALLLCALPTLVLAEDQQVLDCAFTADCVETEACVETDYTLHVTYQPKPVSAAGMMARATQVDVASTTTGLVAVRETVLSYASGAFFDDTEDTRIVVSNGDARLGVTLGEGPMVMSYHGTCEEPN